MHRTPRASSFALVLALTSLLAACGDAAPSPATPGGPTRPSAAVTTAPDLTPVPTPAITAAPTAVPTTEPPEPTTGGGTTETEWGTILDTVPDGFPVFPGASPAEVPDGPASGGWLADAGVDAVADWYAETMAAAGYGVDPGSTLEDGAVVMDVRTDLPECRIQVAFRPGGESTIITVLYGAGCAGGGG